MSAIPPIKTEGQRRAGRDEQARVNRSFELAVTLWDAGWNRVDENYPGTLRRASGDPAYVEVPLEVWFFVRGAFFGIGDHLARKS